MIIRTKDRVKQTGEVFTPLWLVDEMLSQLPEETWLPDKTILDPSCGDGNFLVRVAAWKIWKGSTIIETLSTTYGVDLMPDNTEHAIKRVLVNTLVADRFGRKKLLNHLSHKDEVDFEELPNYNEFYNSHYDLVKKNIICHNALTYNYKFN